MTRSISSLLHLACTNIAIFCLPLLGCEESFPLFHLTELVPGVLLTIYYMIQLGLRAELEATSRTNLDARPLARIMCNSFQTTGDSMMCLLDFEVSKCATFATAGRPTHRTAELSKQALEYRCFCSRSCNRQPGHGSTFCCFWEALDPNCSWLTHAANVDTCTCGPSSVSASILDAYPQGRLRISKSPCLDSSR